MKRKLFSVAAIAICRTKCDLKMKRLCYAATLVLALSLYAPGLHAQANTVYFGTITTSYPDIGTINGKTIYWPSWIVLADYMISEDSQEFLQIGYDGWIDTDTSNSSPLQSSALRASQESIKPVCKSPSGKCNATAPETVVPVTGNANDAYYKVSINPNLLKTANYKVSVNPTQSLLRAESATLSKSDIAKLISKTAPMPSTQIVYTSYQIPLSWTDDSPKLFTWSDLLTDDKRSLSRLDFTAYLGNSLNTDVCMQVFMK